MKLLMGFLGAVSLLAVANSAFADAPCQKCTHDMQVQYRKCMDTKKSQEVCTKEELEAAKICVAICNPQ
jgi:hypothetical protein